MTPFASPVFGFDPAKMCRGTAARRLRNFSGDEKVTDTRGDEARARARVNDDGRNKTIITYKGRIKDTLRL